MGKLVVLNLDPNRAPIEARCLACPSFRVGVFQFDEGRSRAIEHTRLRVACSVFIIEHRPDGSAEIVDIVERRPLTRRARKNA